MKPPKTGFLKILNQVIISHKPKVQGSNPSLLQKRKTIGSQGFFLLYQPHDQYLI